jgi:hypothetical protein
MEQLRYKIPVMGLRGILALGALVTLLSIVKTIIIISQVESGDLSPTPFPRGAFGLLITLVLFFGIILGYAILSRITFLIVRKRQICSMLVSRTELIVVGIFIGLCIDRLTSYSAPAIVTYEPLSTALFRIYLAVTCLVIMYSSIAQIIALAKGKERYEYEGVSS